MRKVMLDLETMGLRPGYVVLSIGAVMFDHEGHSPYVGDHEEQFHMRLATELQHAVGLKSDPDTALWWMDQDDEARKSLLEMTPVDPRQALAVFSDWLEEQVGTPDEREDGTVQPLEVEVWGNGAGFDAPMLREVYDALGLRCPWAWWNDRCYRTERKGLKRHLHRAGLGSADPHREGTQHDALADAVHQADVLLTLESRLTGADSD